MSTTTENLHVESWHPRILLALIGPLLAAIVSVALKFTTELTILIVLIALFSVLMVFIVDRRLDIQNNQNLQSYEKYMHAITTRFPCELIQGHNSVEQTYVRLLDSAKKDMISIGLGVDLSSPKPKAEIGPYLNAMELLLARGVKYQRIQIMEPAPIEWLKFIHKLIVNPQFKDNLDVRFLELPIDYYYHRLFQIFIVDETEVCFFVNIETSSRDKEFVISLTDKETIKELKNHIFYSSWKRTRKYSAEELAKIIKEKEKLRLKIVKKRIGSHLMNLIDRREPYLGIIASVDEFTNVSGRDIIDEYLQMRIMGETVNIWQHVSSLNEQSEKLQIVEKWINDIS